MSVRHVRRLLALLLLTLVACGAGAVVPIRGMPLLQRYSPDDYQAAAGNLSVLALPDGMLYVANVEGLLRFDGQRWDRLELPRQSPARDMALAPDGGVYVGGIDQLGIVRTDATGAMQYEDLRPSFGLDPLTASFGIVWTVLRGERGVYFQTTDRLYFLADDGNHRQWPSSDDVRSLFPIGTELFVRVHGKGLCRFVDGEFVLLAGGERFAERPLYNVFDHDDGLLLVGDEGFLLADASGIRVLPSDAPRVFAETQPYSGIRLPDGSYLFGTYTGELLHFSAELQFQTLHRIGAFTIMALTRDREGGIWAATEGDLVRLQVPAPWSQFGAGDGLIGSITDSEYHDGALWVSTSQGVYRSSDDLGQTRFTLAIETEMEAYSVLSTAEGLLVGDREGALLVPDGGQPQRLVAVDTVYELRPSRFDDDRILALSDAAIIVLERRDGSWRAGHRWPLGSISLSELHEEAANELWISDARGGVVRWRIDPETGAIVERREFGAADGLTVDEDYGSVINILDDRVYVTSGRRTYRREGNRFVAVDIEPFTLAERPWDLDIEQTPYGTYALTTRELWRRSPGGDRFEPVQLGSAVARGYSHVHLGGDGLLRLLTWNALLQFDPNVAAAPLPSLAVGLRSLQRRLADGSVEALPIAADQPVDLPADAALTLDLRLLSMEPGSEYRARIPGMIDRWTEWSSATSPLTLRHPGAGRYVIEAEGRTRSGRLAAPLRLQVNAAPPWWQTVPALLGAALLLLLAIVGVSQLIARIRYRQYLMINRRLEQKIAERTVELEAANRKLSELATEDSLTGVANRRALEQALLREWERCRELNQPLSVVMVDVDHFKQYNDVHGHLAGDQQLIRVARILATHVRPVRELLARFGGEEFALVLPGIGIDDAMQRAEALRLAFIGGDVGGPTVSAGVASVHPTPRQVPDDLIRAADLALYAAKRAGRNRVVRAAPLAGPGTIAPAA